MGSLNGNFERCQQHLLYDLKINFRKKLRDGTCSEYIPSLQNYSFKYMPTALAVGGVGKYISSELQYNVPETHKGLKRVTRVQSL